MYAASFQENADDAQGDGTWAFFNCTVEISRVIGADPRNLLHRFPDDVALVLASIAYKGGDGNGSTQYSSAHYSDAVAWGHLNNINSTSVANLLGRFTVGAIAMMDVINVRGIGSGWALEIGVLLIVDWKLAVRWMPLSAFKKIYSNHRTHEGKHFGCHYRSAYVFVFSYVV